MTTTLVTGANKGIGRETARRLIEAGHDVYLGARDPDRGRRAAQELGATFVPLDVTDNASARAAVATIRDQRGRLDVLVNNAGIPDNTVEDAVGVIVRLASIGPDGPSGTVEENDGPLGW